MAQITAITPQIKDKTRCNIEVDGRFYCGMKLETVIGHRLKVGDAVTAETLSQMQLESEKRTALDKALTHIAASMKTEKEIADFLQKKGYLQDVRDYVIAKMKEYGFLDDGEYAKAYTENAEKRKGRRLIAAELRRKGISEEDIENALQTITGEKESAKIVLDKYMRGKTPDRKTLAKAYVYLTGKGYDYDAARAALVSYGADDED